MTLTNEELDNARAEEAWNIYMSTGESPYVATARLAREGWTPAPAIDPLRLSAREICAKWCEEEGNPQKAILYREGYYDNTGDPLLCVAFDGLKRGMELAREQDKAEPVITEKRCTDPIGCSRDGYCSCGQDKAEPVAPVPVDRAGDMLDLINSYSTDYNKLAVIRTYGDERFAEGERAGIKKAIKWLWQEGEIVLAKRVKSVLIGGAGDE